MDRWELLLIDNASREPLAGAWDLSWHPRARHVSELELGLSFARQRGIRESSAGLLVFVDDDNVLYPDYLSEALRIEHDWPILGTWGSGSILPEFELEPAAHLTPYLPYLALRDNKGPVWSNLDFCWQSMPVGAGLCVRKTVADKFCESYRDSPVKITDRRGTFLGGCEDYEISFVARSDGAGMGLFPELRITHLIPAERVSDDYVLRLLEGIKMSELLLDYKWRGVSPRSPFASGGRWQLKNVLMHRGFKRRVHIAVLRAGIGARRILASQPEGSERVLEEWRAKHISTTNSIAS